MNSMSVKGVATAKRIRIHKAKPLDTTGKRQDPRKERGKAATDFDLIPWSVT